MTLQDLIKESGLKQARLAEACGVSEATISQLIRHGHLPKRNPEAVLSGLTEALVKAGVDAGNAKDALEHLTATQTPETQDDTEEQIAMILKRQSMSQQARQTFGLLRDPFDDPQTPDAVYLSPQSRYVREAMRDAAVNGNFLAVVGESGSGKSVLADELKAHLAMHEKNVVVIEPHVMTMALSDNGAGKPLRISHIIEAILNRVEPSAQTNGSPEIMGQRMREVLIRSAEAGNQHVVLFEEGHDIHPQTLKGLKRMWEQKHNMKRLLSLIILGQTELGKRLSGTSADLREVVQRIDVVTLHPLPDLGEFIRHRFSSAGYDADALFTEDAMDELRQRLIVSRDKTGKGIDMAYPLAVSNLATACINFAAANGLRQIDDDVVRTVQVQ